MGIDVETRALRDGKETSEFKEVQQANVMQYVGLVFGLVLAYGPQLLGMVDSTSTVAVIGGAAIAVVTAINAALVKLGYIKARTELKSAPFLGGLVPPEIDRSR